MFSVELEFDFRNLFTTDRVRAAESLWRDIVLADRDPAGAANPAARNAGASVMPAVGQARPALLSAMAILLDSPAEGESENPARHKLFVAKDTCLFAANGVASQSRRWNS